MAELKKNVNVIGETKTAEAVEVEKSVVDDTIANDLYDLLQDSVDIKDYIKTGIKLQREKFTISEKERVFYRYFIDYENRGRKFKVFLLPPKKFGADRNSASSYGFLDELFGDSIEVDFCMRSYSLKQEDGTIKTGVIYYAVDVDEDGIIYACKLRPDDEADKYRMEIVLQKLKLNNLPI